jgi:hemerythrin-like domain-containing protein
MHEVIALWHTDHVNFGKLLNVLEDQLERFHAGGSPAYGLMLDVMYYMTHYSDVLHHPKEDLVFATIKERAKSAGPIIDELTKQHARLRESGQELVRNLDDIVNGSISSRELVEAAARAYVMNFRNHMRVEETEILPLAARSLRANDWAAVETAIRHIEDPLFGAKSEERYAALRRQIATGARFQG